MNLTMSDEFKLFEQFRTMEFEIDETTTDGIYTFPSTDTSNAFVNLTNQALISLKDPEGSSVSWFPLDLVQDPGAFWMRWGINNEDILVTGQPTEVLYHGNQLVFRTIPDDSYIVQFFGYREIDQPTSTTDELPYDYWLRFIAYGSCKAYAADYRLQENTVANIERNYKRERNLLSKRTHNQVKIQRGVPRF